MMTTRKISHDAGQGPAGRRYKSIPRDPEQNALLLYQRPAGFLARKSSRAAAFPTFVSDVYDGALVTYSDEIVQAFHLFPYYPFFRKKERHRSRIQLWEHCSTRNAQMQSFFQGTTGREGKRPDKKTACRSKPFFSGMEAAVLSP